MPSPIGTAPPGRTSRSGPDDTLDGIFARTDTDIWAVGHYFADGSTLIVHWDGTTWTRVPSPSPKRGGTLFAVTASSARRAWAVGTHGRNEPLIERWNGTDWKLRRAGSSTGALFAITTVPEVDTLWAVGNQIERYC